MKHFLKPLGHCLTTAVMTSAMLRVYALPAVEAATPDSNPSSPQSSPNNPSPNNPPSEAEPAVAPAPAAIAPPEAPTTPEFSAPAAPPSPVPSPAAVSPGPASAKPVEAISPAPQPAAKPVETSPPPKAEANSPARTVSGMRQLVEKRLNNLVSQDKATREAQWQQNLLYTALQYAWAGRFDEARQIASNPALSEMIKTELLGKILAIELQRQANPVPVAQQPNSKPANPAAQPGGRVVPSSYPATALAAGLSSGITYPNVALGGQCPVLPASKLLASKSVSLNQTALNQAAKTPQIPSAQQPATQPGQFPAFVPILGQNLASRLVQISSQTVANPAPAVSKPATKPVQPYAPAISLIGVASGSLQQTVRPQAVTSQAALPSQPPKPAITAGTRQAQSPRLAPAAPTRPTAQPSRSGPAVQPALAAQPPLPAPQKGAVAPAAPTLLSPPNLAPASTPASTPASASPHTATSLLPSSRSEDFRLAPMTPGTAALEAAIPEAATLDQSNWSLDPVSASVNRSLEQFSSILPDWVPNPLNLAWGWWTPAQPGESSQVEARLPGFAVPLLTTQLAQSPLLQTLETSWTRPVSAGRDARKLALPNISFPAKATPAPAKTNPAELLALSCASAQLADRLNSYVIDPAVSKQLGWVNLMFPLPIASVITSAFGWRIHPISGSLSFHSGLDLGAPTGTPVLTASPGRVVGADYMGGYGLAVIVETPDRQRNLYAHLSGIAVQPGMRVNQGTILGWVGSTGNSTGPHLHFETLVQTEDGWTAVDPLVRAGGSR